MDAATELDAWMTPDEVSALTGLNTKTLNNMRSARSGFPFYKPSPKKVLYRRSDIDRYLEATRVSPRLSA